MKKLIYSRPIKARILKLLLESNLDPVILNIKLFKRPQEVKGISHDY